MAVLRVLELGRDDEALRGRALPVQVFDEALGRLLDDMTQTMIAGDGAGLAAPQVGTLQRCCVVELPPAASDDGAEAAPTILELVNPEIVSAEGEITVIEACLSVPGRAGRVVRPEKVTVRAQDRRGTPFELTGERMLAVCLCHEIDHLDGVVYVDRMIEDVTEALRAKGVLK